MGRPKQWIVAIHHYQALNAFPIVAHAKSLSPVAVTVIKGEWKGHHHVSGSE